MSKSLDINLRFSVYAFVMSLEADEAHLLMGH